MNKKRIIAILAFSAALAVAWALAADAAMTPGAAAR